ncbi:TRAP transporter small permease [Natranaerovirga hydrolytica]|nr:TRAP transporter small permease [Natranaerovirga hydrolytica]
MITIKAINRLGKWMYKIYMGIGIFAVAFLATCVISSVIMRYFFGLSYAALEEFMTTLFAFTTFWGIGICIIEDEHIVIDSFYDFFPPLIKKWVTFFNYLIVLFVDWIIIKYGLSYTLQYGKHLSMGMRIPTYWMYGIIPLGASIAFVCIIIKLIRIARAPLSDYEKKIVLK